MSKKSTRCQEVRDGEIMQVIIPKNAQILIIVIAAVTNQQNQPQENRQAKQWAQWPKDSKITLTQESDHYVPTEFSGNFFKQFDLAMKLKREELKKQGKSSNQVNKIMESNLIQAFGVTEDQMEKAALMLNRSESTKKSGNSLA